MSDTPEPFVPPDTDLARLDGFMLDTVRLLGSELVALSTGDEFKAAVLLWCRAWKQVPACSLPDDDRILASFAMVPPAKWKKIKPIAMRGFVKCSDGRFYHRVLAKDGLRAAKAHKQRQDAIRSRWGSTNEVTETIRPYPDRTNEPLTETIPKTGQDGTGRKESKTDPNGSDSGVAAASWGFEGKIIRLSVKDLETWRKTYHAIPDIVAELVTLDAYYDHELQGKDRKNWFIRCSSALDKKHQALLAEAKNKRGGLYGGAMFG